MSSVLTREERAKQMPWITLTAVLATRTGLTRRMAVKVLKTFFEMIKEGLVQDGSFRVYDLGTFYLKRRGERTGVVRFLGTTQVYQTPARNMIKFHTNRGFTRFVNQKR